MIKEFDKWKKSLEEYIEEELGPIPPFEYEESGTLQYEGKDFLLW